MNWLEDWEYPNDHIYAMERYKDIEVSWQKWEEEHASKNKKPAIIKIIKPNEVNNSTSAVRGVLQKRL